MEWYLIGLLILVTVIAVVTIQYNRKSYLNNMDKFRANTDEWYQRYMKASERIAAIDRERIDAERERDDLRNNFVNLTAEHEKVVGEADSLAKLTNQTIEERDALAKSLIKGAKKYELTARVVPVKSLDPTAISKKLALELVFVDNNQATHYLTVRELVKNHRNNAELTRVAASINYKIKQIIEAKSDNNAPA